MTFLHDDGFLMADQGYSEAVDRGPQQEPGGWQLISKSPEKSPGQRGWEPPHITAKCSGITFNHQHVEVISPLTTMMVHDVE